MGNQKSSQLVRIDTKREHLYIPCVKESLSYLKNVDRNYNRAIDMDRVESYIQKQKQIFSESGHFLPIGIIVLCKYQNKYYSCDGSHRMMVFEKLLEEGLEDKTTYLTIEIIQVNDTKEIKYFFEMYNSGIPVPDYVFGDKKDTVEHIIRILRTESKKPRNTNLLSATIKLSDNPNHKAFTIDPNLFGDFIDKYDLVGSGWTMEYCISKLREWNLKAKELVSKTTKTAAQNCNDQNFYLGIYNSYKQELANILK